MDSLKIVPGNDSLVTEKSLESTCHEYGVHDTLRHGFRSIAEEMVSAHALEKHLDQWEETQLNLKLNLRRQIQGLHAPFRTLMERDLVGKSIRHPMFKSSNFGLDILDGKDEFLDTNDFLSDPELACYMPDPHTSFEQTFGFRC